jgi:hypothetical protein
MKLNSYHGNLFEFKENLHFFRSRFRDGGSLERRDRETLEQGRMESGSLTRRKVQLTAAKIDGSAVRGDLCSGSDLIQYSLAVSVGNDETCIAQDTQVVRQEALLNLKDFGQSSNIARLFHQAFHHCQTGTIRQNLQFLGAGQRRGLAIGC